MTIRLAKENDFAQVYALGLATPELQVSITDPFMEPDELRWSLVQPDGAFLVAVEAERLLGFIYANARDMEKPFPNRWACLVYLSVHPDFRKKGIASALYEACLSELKRKGVRTLYGWAHVDSEIERFLQKREFKKGNVYRWYDKALEDERV